MNDLTEERLLELSEKLTGLTWFEGVELFKVTEKSKKHGESSYLLRGLDIEVAEGCGLSKDADGILGLNHSIYAFLIESITDVKLEDKSDYFVGQIDFDGLSILIEKLD